MTDLSARWPLGLSRSTWLLWSLAAIAVLGALSWFDPAAALAVRANNHGIVGFFEGLTRYGETDSILIPALLLLVVSAALLLVIRKYSPRLALLQNAQIFGFIFVAIGLPGLVATLLKRLIGRGRPPQFDEFGQYHFQPIWNDYFYQAFPSGHATTGLGLAFVIGFLAPRYFPLALVFGVGIAISRVVVGAHSVSDILAGAILGTIGAYLIRNFFADRRWVFENTADGVVTRDPVGIQRLLRRQRARR